MRARFAHGPAVPSNCHNVHYRLSNEAADLLGCGDRVPLYAAALIHSALLDGAGSRLARLAWAATRADSVGNDPMIDGLERFRAHGALALLLRAVDVETARRVLDDPVPFALSPAGLAATA